MLMIFESNVQESMEKCIENAKNKKLLNDYNDTIVETDIVVVNERWKWTFVSLTYDYLGKIRLQRYDLKRTDRSWHSVSEADIKVDFDLLHLAKESIVEMATKIIEEFSR